MANKQWFCNGVEFKVGDKVRVVQCVDSHHPDGMGTGVLWPNTWEGGVGTLEDMSGYLGLELVIGDIDIEGVEFEGAGDFSFRFPLLALENLSANQQKEAA